VAAYANSLSGAFVFDDLPTIVDNPTIRHVWPLGPVFHPPAATTATGRPLLNLSFALNYAIGGTEVRGYHVLNVSIHLLAGLTLFGCIRRTLRRVGSAGGATADPTWLALAAAGIWVVHPLATESVDYVVQRAESLMGLLYLFTLYGFIRSSAEKPGRASTLWLSASVLACAAGMAVKEVMVTAPVMVLLYDRTFAAGTLRAAWRQRRLYYLGLAARFRSAGCSPPPAMGPGMHSSRPSEIAAPPVDQESWARRGPMPPRNVSPCRATWGCRCGRIPSSSNMARRPRRLRRRPRRAGSASACSSAPPSGQRGAGGRPVSSAAGSS
jgi:hypothetical protein